MEYLNVVWNGRTYRLYVKGHIADPKNEKKVNDFMDKVEEQACGHTKS